MHCKETILVIELNFVKCDQIKIEKNHLKCIDFFFKY